MIPTTALDQVQCSRSLNSWRCVSGGGGGGECGGGGGGVSAMVSPFQSTQHHQQPWFCAPKPDVL